MYTRDEFLSKFQNIIGDRNDDEILEFLDNIREIYDAVEKPADWERRYKENDENWRKRYRDAFFNGPKEVIEDTIEEVKEEGTDVSFDDLFIERDRT